MPICTKDEHCKILNYIAANIEKAVDCAMRHLDGIEAGLNAQAMLQKEASLIDLRKSKIPSLS